MKTHHKSSFFKIIINTSFLYVLLTILLFNCSDGPSEYIPEELNGYEETELTILELNLRVHIMQDSWLHPTGENMYSWVSPADVTNLIVPEMNGIWDQAKIKWNIESIIEEDVVKSNSYQSAINYIVNCGRDSEGERQRRIHRCGTRPGRGLCQAHRCQYR